MPEGKIAAGVVHSVPEDLGTTLTKDSTLLALWQSLSPLARNEWLCWIESAKKAETRRRRIERLSTELKEGIRRPCCWPGCPHR